MSLPVRESPPSGPTAVDDERETLLGPQQLYELWERQHWLSHAIDLRRDREQWADLPLGLRERLTWHIAAFFVGEDSVTVHLSALVAAHESPAEAAFLATQQVDEARHAQHFNRLYRDVLGIDGGDETRLAQAREQLSAPTVELLDSRLVDAAARLAAQPGDPAAKVAFVIVYHMIIEGMIALTGQRMLLDYLDRHNLLAGWREGLRMVARDEHRHVAYGTWLLRRKLTDEALRPQASALLAELVPLAGAVLVPPGARDALFRPLDWTGVELKRFAQRLLARRLMVIGLPMPASASASLV